MCFLISLVPAVCQGEIPNLEQMVERLWTHGGAIWWPPYVRIHPLSDVCCSVGVLEIGLGLQTTFKGLGLVWDSEEFSQGLVSVSH